MTIEIVDYFRQPVGDDKYRRSVDDSLDEIPVQQVLESRYPNLLISGPTASYESKRHASRIEFLKGYCVLRDPE